MLQDCEQLWPQQTDAVCTQVVKITHFLQNMLLIFFFLVQKLHYQITPISPGESLKQKGRTIFSTSAVLKRDTCSLLPRPTSTATRDQTRGKWGLSPRRHRRKTEPNIRKGLWYRNTMKTTRRKKKTAAAGCYGAAGHNAKPLWATAGSRKRTPFYHYNYQCVWISASSYLEKKNTQSQLLCAA